jgi:hypothetical protein
MRIENWYVGVVEDINDLQGQGRVRVRCLGYHTPDRNQLPTIDLPLATVMLPTTSASVAGIGLSATALIPNTWVFGFFRDGAELQDPVIMGTIASASGYDVGYDVTGNIGFGDPHGALDSFIGNDMPPEAGTATSPTAGTVANSFGAANAANGAYMNSNGLSTSFDQPQAQFIPNGGMINAVNVARSQLQVREQPPGSNNGADIKKFWSATNNPSGYGGEKGKWCAAFMCWCVQQSGVLTEDERPKSAACFEWESWARGKPYAQLRLSPRYIRAGDIFICSSSHIGIATTDSDANGSFGTIEGNTSGEGIRDGWGVFERKRNLNKGIQSAITISKNASVVAV